MRPTFVPGAQVMGINLRRFSQWNPTLAIWGLSASIAVFYIPERVPYLRQIFYQHIPIIGSYWKNKI